MDKITHRIKQWWDGEIIFHPSGDRAILPQHEHKRPWLRRALEKLGTLFGR